jgi:hypothetical protein
MPETMKWKVGDRICFGHLPDRPLRVTRTVEFPRGQMVEVDGFGGMFGSSIFVPAKDEPDIFLVEIRSWIDHAISAKSEHVSIPVIAMETIYRELERLRRAERTFSNHDDVQDAAAGER